MRQYVAEALKLNSYEAVNRGENMPFIGPARNVP